MRGTLVRRTTSPLPASGHVIRGWREQDGLPCARVLIVGGPGSGKTTLAHRLADQVGCPCFELDAVGYEGGAGPERSPADRQRDIATIVNQRAWVAEGSYTGWIDPLATAADVIVWLDVPWRTARHRLITRHVKASLRRSNRHRGLRKLWRFVRFAQAYYTATEEGQGRVQTATWLAGFTTPVIVCRTNADLERLIAGV
jgi:hypothetical protein